MTSEAMINGGFAEVESGEYLAARLQPAAAEGSAAVRGLSGLIAPDRAQLARVKLAGRGWFAGRNQPFLTRLDALPDRPLAVVSRKLLLALLASRVRARQLRLIPMSFKGSLTVTELKFGWAVAATASRVTRVSLDEGGTLTVRPEALVAWIGPDPSGHCPRLRLRDILLPRTPRTLTFNFHGPCTVWFEGGDGC